MKTAGRKPLQVRVLCPPLLPPSQPVHRRTFGLVQLTLGLVFTACHATPFGSQPIPLGDRPPFRAVLVDSGFRIAMDTAHVQKGPDDGWLVWFITTHAEPRGPDSLRFDRGRIRLLVRCAPLAFKSVSQELALGDSRPVSHQQWRLNGPNAVPWRTPEAGATDDRFLRAACELLPRAP